MKVDNVHERLLTAAAEDVTALFADMDRLWPTVSPVPEPESDLIRVGKMLWRPVERDGSPRAYDIVEPEEFRASHWFEVDDGERGTVLRHTVRGEAVGAFEPVWRDRMEPRHDAYIEAVFDRAEEALA